MRWLERLIGRWFRVGVVLWAAALPAAAQQPAELPDLAERLAKARAVTKTYAERLRAELAAALKDGGPKASLGACSTIAPEINTSLAAQFEFEVGRTALRVRNPDNAPDPWEQAILELFAKQIASGSEPHKLEAHAVTTTKEGQKLFRYMRPIMTHETCLACHGPSVSQDVKSEIARYYTDDKAIGYNLGELRGAFTLVQQLE